MADLEVPNLTFLRSIPIYGAKLYEALNGIRLGVNAVVKQTNANPSGQPESPPNIDALNVTAQDGHFHISVTDQSSGLRRGVQYRIEHADNPAFIGAHPIVIGDSRSYDMYMGNVTRYFRASSSYPSSNQSQHVYHGTQTEPTPVIGGGPTAGPMFLPSQGSGTGAPGQSAGPGPVPVRTDASGFDWRLQQPVPVDPTTQAVSPGSQGGIGSAGGSGGGGGSVTVTESIIAAAENIASIGGTGNAITGITSPSYSALASGFLVRYIPSNSNSGATTLNVNGTGAKAVTKNGTTALVGGELVAGIAYLLLYDGTRWQIIGTLVSESIIANSETLTSIGGTGDAITGVTAIKYTSRAIGFVLRYIPANANAGATTINENSIGAVAITKNGTTALVGGELLVGVTYFLLFDGTRYQIVGPVGSASQSTGSWTPTLSFGGGSTGLTYGTVVGGYVKTGSLIVATFDMTLDALGSSTGIAEINGLPFSVAALEVTGGSIQFAENMAALAATPTILPEVGTSKASLFDWGATGAVNLIETNFSGTPSPTRIIGTVTYVT